MRKYSLSLFLILLLPLMLWLTPANAADAYNQGTLTVQYQNQNAICYKWVVSTGTDSTGSKHSPAINLDGVGTGNGRIYAIAAATSDVNILVHNLVATSSAVSLGATTYEGLDAVSTTAKVDTLGWLDGATVGIYHVASAISVEVDGQTGTAANVNITLYIVLPKNSAGGSAPRPYWVNTTGTF